MGFRMVHRNLESSNVLVSARGHPKLTGFHASKIVTGKTSTTCGTLEYMAPEMLMGMRYTRAVDWWALGVLTPEILMGCYFQVGSNAGLASGSALHTTVGERYRHDLFHRGRCYLTQAGQPCG